jgi:hypothetical protein
MADKSTRDGRPPLSVGYMDSSLTHSKANGHRWTAARHQMRQVMTHTHTVGGGGGV